MTKRKFKIGPYLLVSPYVLFFLIFVAFPVLFSFYLTFHKWNVISPMEYSGLYNYEKMLHDRLFYKSLINTLYFLAIHIPLQLVFSLGIAVLLNTKIKFSSFFRAAFFLPFIVSGVVVTIMWQQLYGFNSGLINRLLTDIGLDRIGWLTTEKMSMPSIAIMATWKNVGLYIVLFLVGLQTIPKYYYEVADLEGATDWQKFKYITLPALNPTIFMVVIFSTIGGFSLFIEPYVMTGGGPLNSSLSSVLYIYKQAFDFYHMGYAATLGFTFAIFILLVIVLQKRFLEKNY
ncbi:sugar ABC transporter permease [Lutibacter sp.]|uniref:carbohydrate ABC transporter permease n=1 Tax=Lutibacter sp. TaxID=1925666 RepID=UPI0025C3E916|nr:sugar ABC transporter permease [Lutibacter sp.]MCF6181925.1 sugar ABC transporter permease [Lutibacter sp.]